MIPDPDGPDPVPTYPSSIPTPTASRRRIRPVPTDQPGHLIAEEAQPQVSPIENELPMYRAISNRAVFSLICGVLASFSFADLTFLVFAALAVILGVLANRAIARTPDVLTGTRIANAGIALGLIFGLIVLTYTGVHTLILKREATRFAKEYARILKEGSVGDLLLYREPPDTRKDHTAESKQKELDDMKLRDRTMMEQRLGSLFNLHKAVKSQGAQLKFQGIETQGVDDSMVGSVYYFAAALYDVDGVTLPGSKEPQTLHALAIFKGRSKGRHYEWWADDVRFPYMPASYQGEVKKPADDGHGHAGH
jgi:hypothetical protein